MIGKNNTLAAYTYEFKRITNILAAHETMLPEEVKVAIYLAGLSPAYQQAKNILNTAPKANLLQCYDQLRVFAETND